MNPDTTTTLIGTVTIPYGWTTARARVWYYTPSTAGAGDVRIGRAAVTFRSDATPVATPTTNNTITAPTPGRANSFLITDNIDLTGMSRVCLSVQRVGGSSVDTLGSPIFFLSVRLERTS